MINLAVRIVVKHLDSDGTLIEALEDVRNRFGFFDAEIIQIAEVLNANRLA